jgi:hypothetical protein
LNKNRQTEEKESALKKGYTSHLRRMNQYSQFLEPLCICSNQNFKAQITVEVPFSKIGAYVLKKNIASRFISARK